MAGPMHPDIHPTTQLLTCSVRQAGQYQAARGGAVSGGSKQCMWNPRSQPSHSSMSRARACKHGWHWGWLGVIESCDTSARASPQAYNARNHTVWHSTQQQPGNVAGRTLEAQTSQAVSS